MSKRLYIVPDFYTDFKCKAGSCRRSCCYGWHITISMEEYYRLIGLDCPPNVRQKLDGGVFMLDVPTKERFAEFAKSYTGDCKLHGEDGLCSLQCACGEDCLPSVCRYYPRSPKTLHATECSLSASCEGVCELLMNKKDPIQFKETELDFKYHLPEMSGGFVTDCYKDVREAFIKLLQNRSAPFSARMKTLIKAAEIMNPPYKKRSAVELKKVAAACKDLPILNIYSPVPESAVSETVYILTRLSEKFPIDKYTDITNNITFADYTEKRAEFEKNHPDSEVIFEQIMVNHVFYEGFPFYNVHEDIYTMTASLTALYAVWKLTAVSCLSDDSSQAPFADLTSDIFRMAENSNFDLCAAALLEETGFFAPDKLSALCDL